MSFGIKESENEEHLVRVDTVVLPSWTNNRHYFTYKMALSLEHPLVSQTIHHWIDLIFGDKQQDPIFFNLFKPLTNEKYIKERECSEYKLSKAEISQIVEFGNNPIQILDKANPMIDSIDISLFDPYFPVQSYSNISYKPREPFFITWLIAKDRSTIYTLNTNFEVNRVQYFFSIQ